MVQSELEKADKGGLNQTLKQVDDNSTRNCVLITNSSSLINIDTKKEEITFSSKYRFSIYHGRRWFGFNIDEDQTISYRIDGHEFVQIKYDITNKRFVIDNISSVGDFVVVGYIVITGHPLVTLFANLYTEDGKLRTSFDSLKVQHGIDLSLPFRTDMARAAMKIKHIKFHDCHRNTKISYFGNLKEAPNGIRIRDADSNESLCYKLNLESNKLYTFDLLGGGFVSLILDYTELAEDEVYLNGGDWLLEFNRQQNYIYSDNRIEQSKYPWDESSQSDSIDILKKAIKDIDLRGVKKDKFYSFWIDTKNYHNSENLEYYRIQLVETDTAEYVSGQTKFQAILEYYVKTKDDIKNEFVEFVMRPIVANSDVYCRLLINSALLPSIVLQGSNGAYSQSQFKMHDDVFNGGRYFSENIDATKSGVGFQSFKMQDFGDKWMCNVLEVGYDENKRFALDSWDNNTFVNNVYEPLRQRYPRFVTRSDNPIYSVDDVNGVAQNCYLYEFTPEHYSRTIFINTGTHSRESEGWLGTAKMLQLIYDHWQDSEVLEYLRFNVRFIIVPVHNVWGLSVYPRENDLNANHVNLNRNWDSRWKKGAQQGFDNVAGEFPFSEIETQVLRDILHSRKDEIDFVADNHTTVWSSFGDYSLDYGTPARWGNISNVQRTAVGYLLTKNVINEDKRTLSDGRKANIPFQPYFGSNAYATPNSLAAYVRDVLQIPASIVEHSDFVWSDKRGTSTALRFAVEWYTNFFYNIARNL